MSQIEFTPIQSEKNKPGTADWRSANSGQLLGGLHTALGEAMPMYSAVVTLGKGAPLQAEVFCDNKEALDSLVNYMDSNFEAGARMHTRETIEVDPEVSKISYLTTRGIIVGDDRIGEAGLPYEGIYDQSGNNYLAVGRNSIGTFKSLVIGAMSGKIASKKPELPVHSAIVISPDGEATAISGRGNTGKTTTLLSVYEKLSEKGFKVLTDDWAFINEHDGRVIPIDYLAGIRPESIPGLRGDAPSEFMQELLARLESSLKSESGTPSSIHDLFGDNNIGGTGTLRSILFTNVNELLDGSQSKLFTPIDDSRSMGFRLRDDAYHSPSIHGEEQADLLTRYQNVTTKMECGYVYTRADKSDRQKQASMVAEWIISTVS